MALINLIAKSQKEINWKYFLDDYYNLEFSDIEVFPIPKDLGFAFDSIGVSVHSGYSNRKTVILELERMIVFYSSKAYNLKFIELYDGIEIHPDNASTLFDKLLPY
jgi:hypothetical protein